MGHFLLVQLFILLVLAWAGPELGIASITPTSQARDLLLIVDVSQSMLAEDKPPLSRLTRARESALQLVRYLHQRRNSSRVGLVAFAGRARLLCPPTEDLDHVARLLSELSTESLGSVGRTIETEGNTIGTSLGVVAKLLDEWLKTNPDAREFTDCLILSDGDDLSNKLDTQVFTSLGMPVHALAIGDPNKDWPIPMGSGYLMVTGSDGSSSRAVTRRQDEKLLTLTQQTQGQFLTEESAVEPLVVWWQRFGESQPGRVLQSQTRTTPINRADWLLCLAAIVLALEMTFGGVRRREW